MSQEQYSLASKLLEKYRENVARELAERKNSERGGPFRRMDPKMLHWLES